MSDTPRSNAAASHKNRLWMDSPRASHFVPASFAMELEEENTTLRNYLMTLASDGAKPGDAKTIWRKVRGEML